MNGTLAERVAERVSTMLAGRGHNRRHFLGKAALVGTALAVNPFDFILRPGTAYATVCGPEPECNQGWSALCCTVNGGANTCPPGSFIAGWWKAGNSSFCRGEARYIVDCNRSPGSSCGCHCASGACDHRRVCCNVFRYGQCNQHIAGTTAVVCRIAICTPPWEWDPACTATLRSDGATVNHSSTCMPKPNPSLIEITYADMGLVGSPLGAVTVPEADGPRGGRWTIYEQGVITWVEAFGVQVLIGEIGLHYAALGGPATALGYPLTPVTGVGDGRGSLASFEGGTITASPETGAHEVHDPIATRYALERGPTGWLGYPIEDVTTTPAGHERAFFEAGWSLVHDIASGEVVLLPSDVELPADGSIPPRAEVVRWYGQDRISTAARVALEAFPDDAPAVVIARADDFADALVGGVLAGLREGPLLLTARDELSEPTAEQLARLRPDVVYVLGGEAAVADAVLEEVADLLPDADVQRLAGPDRYATAAAISTEAFPDAPEQVRGGATDAPTPEPTEEPTAEPEPATARRVFVVNAGAFADALAVVPAAAAAPGPVLLSDTGQVPAATAEELARLRPEEVVLVGGTGVLTDDVERFLGLAAEAPTDRWAGDGRYDTAAIVAANTVDAASTVFVATGAAFADGLAAGPAAIAAAAPLLLLPPDDVPAAVEQQLRRLAPQRIVVVGGEAAINAEVVRRLEGFPAGA